ncbi:MULTISPECIES: hypothetical protein [unclassified Streptomyces]|uniref:hypothetical protein n=1 Tax=unclassified Streptomyces TaxID=2593676 RepID=UPI0013DD2965|nr:hypothetical protein [Streptomyces sp. SID10853]WSU40829.1 hypothetical protein OG510_05955 [Streptomyces sp. NBC_01089]
MVTMDLTTEHVPTEKWSTNPESRAILAASCCSSSVLCCCCCGVATGMSAVQTDQAELVPAGR